MKKIIMLLTVAAMLATSVIGVSAVDYTAGEDGKYTGVAYSGLTANEYYGVVVVEGTTAASVDFSNKDSILYIDQVTADETGAITIPAFMTKGDELVEGTIFIGGAGLPTATNIGYLKLAQSSEPEKFVISGTVTGYAGTTLPVVKVTDGTTEYTATYAEGTANFSVEVLELESGSYTLTATKAAHLKYTKNAADATAITATVKPGNLNGDTIANLDDILLVVGNFNQQSGAENSTYTSAYDINEDTILNLDDILLIVGNFNQQDITE